MLARRRAIGRALRRREVGLEDRPEMRERSRLSRSPTAVRGGDGDIGRVNDQGQRRHPLLVLGATELGALDPPHPKDIQETRSDSLQSAGVKPEGRPKQERSKRHSLARTRRSGMVNEPSRQELGSR